MKEEDIRPKAIFDEYLRLARIDSKDFFGATFPREVIKCPACNMDGEFSFSKDGFDYELCPACSTLFVSPRPEKIAFELYYSNAPSTKYWATTFYKSTADARREKIWRQKVNLIIGIIHKYGFSDENIIDIGGGYGVFAEEMFSSHGKSVIVIEPGKHFASSLRNRGIGVVEKFLEDVEKEDIPEGNKFFVSFELFEHLHSPELFLNKLFKLMNGGDVLIFTTLSSMGIDILALWENSKSVSPPHHLNFLNPKSVKILIERVGFRLIEINTPGVLDIDILTSNVDLIKDRFLQTFIKYSSQEDKKEWQKLISNSGWSSHMMVCCQKPNKDKL